MQPEFKVKDGKHWYDVYRVKGRFILVREGQKFEDAVQYTYSINNDPTNWINIVDRHPVTKPKTERQIALEQAIKIHKLNIEHNELMIQKYEEALKNES